MASSGRSWRRGRGACCRCIFWCLDLALRWSLQGTRCAPCPGRAWPARAISEPDLPPDFFWHFLAHALLAQGLIPQGALPYAYVTLLGPAWSLSTEWQFYILMGLFAGRRIRSFALGLLAVGVIYHFLRLSPWWQFSRAFLPDAAPFFALGLSSSILLVAAASEFLPSACRELSRWVPYRDPAKR